MPPSICEIGGQESHVFYEPPHVAEHYFENYQSYQRGTPPSFRNLPSQHSRNYGSAYNFRVGRIAVPFDSNTRTFSNKGRQNSGVWERHSRPRKSNKWINLRISEIRSSPNNDTSSPPPASGESVSGVSDSSSKYKHQTNSSQQNVQWHGHVRAKHVLKDDLSKKKINDLRAKIEMLQNDQEARGRQLNTTKKQVISNHHKLQNAKNQIEDLNKEVVTLREQNTLIKRSSTEKTRIIAELKKYLADSQKEVEKFTKQLDVSKQLLVQKDEHYRQSIQQFLNCNNYLRQKNYQLNQKYSFLQQSYERSLQKIQTIRNLNHNLQVDNTKLQKNHEELQEVEHEHEARIERLLTKLSGWVVPVASSDVESSDCEYDFEEESSHPKIIPEEFVPGFIFDESELTKEDRIVKPKRVRNDGLKCSIPKIPSSSVLKQIFEIGRRMVHPDQTKKKVPSKSYPRPIDRLPRGVCVEKDSIGEGGEDKYINKEGPWHLTDLKLTTRATFDKLHVGAEPENDQLQDVKH